MTAEWLIFPYLRWLAKRPIDHYQNASVKEEPTLNRCLARFDGEALVNLPLRRRLVRPNNKLYQA